MACPVFTIRRAKSGQTETLPLRGNQLRSALLLGCFLLAAAGTARAQEQNTQDLAEAARQERARKQQQKSPTHVYTNDDLHREKILMPEDKARSSANHKQPLNSVAKQNTAPVDANADPTSEPLGEVARRYGNRRRKAQQLSPFHLPSGEQALAAPMRTPALPHRVDPFARRLPQPGAPPIPKPVIPAGIPPDLRSLPPTAMRFVTVQPGDSLWKIARQTLGRGSNWYRLMATNPAIVDPSHLLPGTQLVVPTNPVLRKTASTRVTVRHGDTLSAIALAQFGRASLWHCIARANPDLEDASRIYAGQSLLLPSICLP